jgi:ubiquinone biosynthesis O-methyltransferase
LARLGAQVTGIDALKENIAVAQLRAESQYEKSNGLLKFYERIRYFNCSLEDLAMCEENFNYFDAIVMSEVVEHVNNLDDFLINSCKLLKNHGYQFITTINRTNQSYLLAILAAEYVLNLVPRGTHTWEKFVKPEDIKTILEKSKYIFYFKFNEICSNMRKIIKIF